MEVAVSWRVVMGRPEVREKLTGSTMACIPVMMALPANITLTVLKIGRRRFMIDRDEDCCVCA